MAGEKSVSTSVGRGESGIEARNRKQPTQPAQESLIWINKTTNSTSLSNLSENKDEVQRVYSHVQRLRLEKVREKRLQRLQFAPSKRMVNIAMKTPPEQKMATRKGEPDGRDDITTANFRKEDCVDPFNSTCIPITAEVHKLVTYYWELSTPVIPKADADGKSVNHQRHTARVRETIRGCLDKEIHMYALLAWTAGRRIYYEEPHCTNLPARSQYFMYKAMQHLRMYFASDFASEAEVLRDTQVIMTLIFVLTYEWYLEDYKAALIHLRIMRHLFTFLNDSREYDRWVQEVGSNADVFISTSTLTQPVLPWKTAGGHFPLLQQLSTASTGRGFQIALDNGYFGESMASVIAKVVSGMQVWKVTQIASIGESAWTTQQIDGIIHRLLSLTDAMQPEEECCRIALVLLLSGATSASAKRSSPRLAVRMLEPLRAVNRYSTINAPDETLLWSLIVGISAAKPTERVHLAEEAVHLARVLQIEDYAQLRDLMVMYLWVEKVQGPILQELSTLISGGLLEDSP